MSLSKTNTLSADYCLYAVMKYAAPVLIPMDLFPAFQYPFDRNNTTWFLVLETTRFLLAHCTTHCLGKEFILDILAHNLRNLYRLFDPNMDLSQKEYWSEINGNQMFLFRNGPDSKLRVPSNPDEFRANLVEESFDIVQAEFECDRDCSCEAVQLFGRVVYRLVATSDSGWKRCMQRYA